MDFRAKLEATLRAARSLFEVPGVLVVGSEVPNLLEPRAAATLVVSQDVDIGVPVAAQAAVRGRLPALRGLKRSADEPSVWLPDGADLLELNFVGMDAAVVDPADTYVLDDPELPLLVFAPLSLLSPGQPILVGDLAVPVPRPAGLTIEKLVTDRAAEKGARDLLVVAGLVSLMGGDDLAETVALYRSLPDDLRHAARSNLTILSLMEPLPGMPDPRPLRARLAALLSRLEAAEVRR